AVPVRGALDRARSAHIMPRESPQTPRWRNWQTHYFEVVAGQPVEVRVLSWALKMPPSFAGRRRFRLYKAVEAPEVLPELRVVEKTLRRLGEHRLAVGAPPGALPRHALAAERVG